MCSLHPGDPMLDLVRNRVFKDLQPWLLAAERHLVPDSRSAWPGKEAGALKPS